MYYIYIFYVIARLYPYRVVYKYSIFYMWYSYLYTIFYLRFSCITVHLYLTVYRIKKRLAVY